jgi:hypothetical protein
MLGIVWALKRLHSLISGYKFRVETDHKPLVTIWKKSIAATSPRLQRLHLELAHYGADCNIEYIPGSQNKIADALSRVGHHPDPIAEAELPGYIPVHQITTTLPASQSKIQEWRDSTDEDDTLRLLKQVITDGWPEDKRGLHPSLLEYWSYREELSLEDGLIYKLDRLVIPLKQREESLQTLHQGHFGVEKTKLRARETIFWPGINQDIQNMTAHCGVCQEYQNSQQKEPLTTHEVPTRPWEKLGSDLFELESANYILIADYFSRYPIVKKLASTTSKAIINCFTEVFSEHGVPKLLITDNGPQYASLEFKNFSKEWEFTHYTSSPRYPQSNGFAERMVQTVKKTIKKCKDSNQNVAKALLTYRATPLSHDLPSPIELLNSRKARVPGIPSHARSTSSQSQQRELMLHKKEAEQQHYDHRTRELPKLCSGQAVYTQLDPLKNRWTPARVEELPTPRTPNSYSLRTMDGGRFRRNRRHIRIVPEGLVRGQEQSNTTLPPPTRVTQETAPSVVPLADSAKPPVGSSVSSITLPKRVSKPPDRLIMSM